MSELTWKETPAGSTAIIQQQIKCVVKNKDIGGWIAEWQDDTMWPVPEHMAHLPKAAPQRTKFFVSLPEAKAAVEALLNA